LLALTRLAIFFSSNKMPDSPSLRAVIFRVGDLVCAVPAGIVREVLPPLPATRIPGVGDAVGGLVNVRGALLTVFDAHALLVRERQAEDEGALVVLERGEQRCGLLVGEVLDFFDVPAEAMAPREQLPGVDPRLVRAVGHWADRHFILLDLDALLAPAFGGWREV
jgi:purine-binding chemotaxis protein CheW